MTVDPTTPEGWAQRWQPTIAERPSRRVIDAHTHMLVPESAEMTRHHFKPEMDPRSFFSAPDSKELNSRFYQLVADKFTDPASRVADMDALGVDTQLVGLSPFHFFYWADEQLAPKVVSLQNDRIAELCAHDPERLVGIGTLPWAHPALAVDAAEQVKQDHGFPGVYTGADINGVDLDDPRFEPVWEALAALGLVVIMHPAGFTHGQRLTDYYLVNVIGMPLSSTLTVTRMILGGVFERHPGLRMLVMHGGGYLPFYSARTDHAFRHRPELRKNIDRLPSEFLGDLYYDICVFDPGMVEHLVQRFGADHVLLGTDYPFDMGLPDPLALVEASQLSPSERDMIVGGSAERLFGLVP